MSSNTLKDRVRIKLGAMGPDEFERFMSELLIRIYPDYVSIEPSYNFMGKTTKGKCDAHCYHEADDTYTAIICTTQQSVVSKKVLVDVNKLSEAKFSSKIRRVLLCINTPIGDEVEEYRTACQLKGWSLKCLSLESITNNVLAEHDLLQVYFGEHVYTKPTSVSPTLTRRFDCGNRLKEAREGIGLSISRLIEAINFPSEREWKFIEAGDIDVAECYIKHLSEYSGISDSWLKHGDTQKYPYEVIYDYQLDKIRDIASQNPLKAFVALEPKSMDSLLLVQLSEFSWKVFVFGFSMNFWDWVGDEHHIPVIFKLLTTVNAELKSPYGRLITRETLADFLAGVKHPLVVFKQAGANDYWFDDLFDLQHSYPIAKDGYKHHGDWFVKLQDYFRKHVDENF